MNDKKADQISGASCQRAGCTGQSIESKSEAIHCFSAESGVIPYHVLSLCNKETRA